MEFNQNRLRFVHCEHLFNNVDEIKNYVRSIQHIHASLYAEPMILKYGDVKKPCIVLAIGSVGEGKFAYDTENGTVLNETFYIDFAQAERDIAELYKRVGENKEEIERIDGIVKNIIKSSGFNENGEYVKELDDLILKNAESLKEADKLLSEYIIALEKRQELYVNDSNSIDFKLDKSETGTTLSGDVKRGSKIVDNKVIKNIIIEQEDGIFTNVDLDYVESDSKLVFTINGDEKKDIKLPVEAHVIEGKYDTYNENIVLTLNKGVEINGVITDKINISMADLIDEWTVMGEASKTPIVLTKEHIKSEDLAHEGHHDWQDVLRADVRILDSVTMPDNILKKDSTGKFLYVEGKAENISYMDGNSKVDVQKALDGKISKTSISKNNENTIVYREDGLYSYIDFDYDSSTNKIIFRRTNPKGEVVTVEKELNHLSLIQKAYYDSEAEEIVIIYKDAKNEIQELRIPMQIIVDSFDVDNSDTTVTLYKLQTKPGVDKLKAEVNIAKKEDNILEDLGHALYVRGTAENITMIDKSLGQNVEAALASLKSSLNVNSQTEKEDREEADRVLDGKISEEVARAKSAEKVLQDNIDAEQRRATKAESDIITKYDREVEISRETEQDNLNAITRESERAVKKESEIEQSLNAEKERSINRDDSIERALNEEVIRAKGEEGVIRQEVLDETKRALQAEKDIDGKLEAEIKRSVDTDDVLTNSISTEVNRAVGVENKLRTDLTDEVERAKTEEQLIKDSVKNTNSHVDILEKDLVQKIKDEQFRAEKIEESIKTNLDGEIKRATEADKNFTTSLSEEINRAKERENGIEASLNSEIKTSKEKDDFLEHELIVAKQSLAFNVKESGTLQLFKTKSLEDGNLLSGKVLVSSKRNNLINNDDEALFASVDLLYDSATNKLTLLRSGDVDKEIQLNAGSLIESIIYDQDTKELIITYYDSHGEQREERVKVGDLFNQWVVDNDNLGGVQLHKEANFDGNGVDKLSAEILISELPSNILVNDKGSLYVPNSSDSIKLPDGSSITETVNGINDKIAAETKRASDEEKRIEGLVTAEITRAETKEEALSEAIKGETERAERIENDLSTKIDNNSVKIGDNAEKIKALEDNVNDLPNNYSLSVKDTPTVSLVKDKIDGGGYMLSSNVKLSTTTKNDIVVYADGIFSNVDLTYTNNNNTLHFAKNGNTLDIPLNSISTIDSITYDSVKSEIVIKYHTSNAEGKETRFPASQLFKPLEVNNDGKNVKLEINQVDGGDVISGEIRFIDNINNTDKTVKLDTDINGKLTADVNVSDLEDNIIEVDRSYNLYVKGTADNIKVTNKKLGADVEEALNTISDKLRDLENQTIDISIFDCGDYDGEDYIK